MLEQIVESLAAMPAVVADLALRTGNLESHFLQLRSEMQGGFSSIRNEISGTRSELKGELNNLRVELRGEVNDLRVELKDEVNGLRGELKREVSGLRDEVAALRLGLEATRVEVTSLARSVDSGLEQLGTDMRSLHEEVIDRIKLLHEGRQAAPPGRRPKR